MAQAVHPAAIALGKLQDLLRPLVAAGAGYDAAAVAAAVRRYHAQVRHDALQARSLRLLFLYLEGARQRHRVRVSHASGRKGRKANKRLSDLERVPACRWRRR